MKRLRAGGSAKDLARYLFWVELRRRLDPRKPGQLRALWPLWRAQAALGGAQRHRMEEELQACFGSTAGVEEAWRVAFRVHLEELLLGQLDARTLPLYMGFERREALDEALGRGKGALILLPHAGNVMLMIALLGLSGYRYTQVAARGLAPDAVAKEHPEAFGHNRWRKAVREAREGAEDRLPARFLELDAPPRALFRALADNQLVGIAYDGRIAQRFAPVDYLGRTALLATGPYKLAALTGAAIVPAFNLCPPEGPNRCQLGEPLWGEDPEALREAFLAQAQAWLRRNPGHYGLWLAHCKERRAVDDHPLFVDYAPDERWRRWT